MVPHRSKRCGFPAVAVPAVGLHPSSPHQHRRAAMAAVLHLCFWSFVRRTLPGSTSLSSSFVHGLRASRAGGNTAPDTNAVRCPAGIYAVSDYEYDTWYHGKGILASSTPGSSSARMIVSGAESIALSVSGGSLTGSGSLKSSGGQGGGRLHLSGGGLRHRSGGSAASKSPLQIAREQDPAGIRGNAAMTMAEYHELDSRRQEAAPPRPWHFPEDDGPLSTSPSGGEVTRWPQSADELRFRRLKTVMVLLLRDLVPEKPPTPTAGKKHGGGTSNRLSAIGQEDDILPPDQHLFVSEVVELGTGRVLRGKYRCRAPTSWMPLVGGNTIYLEREPPPNAAERTRIRDRARAELQREGYYPNQVVVGNRAVPLAASLDLMTDEELLNSAVAAGLEIAAEDPQQARAGAARAEGAETCGSRSDTNVVNMGSGRSLNGTSRLLAQHEWMRLVQQNKWLPKRRRADGSDFAVRMLSAGGGGDVGGTAASSASGAGGRTSGTGSSQETGVALAAGEEVADLPGSEQVDESWEWDSLWFQIAKNRLEALVRKNYKKFTDYEKSLQSAPRHPPRLPMFAEEVEVDAALRLSLIKKSTFAPEWKVTAQPGVYGVVQLQLQGETTARGVVLSPTGESAVLPGSSCSSLATAGAREDCANFLLTDVDPDAPSKTVTLDAQRALRFQLGQAIALQPGLLAGDVSRQFRDTAALVPDALVDADRDNSAGGSSGAEPGRSASATGGTPGRPSSFIESTALRIETPSSDFISGRDLLRHGSLSGSAHNASLSSSTETAANQEASAGSGARLNAAHAVSQTPFRDSAEYFFWRPEQGRAEILQRIHAEVYTALVADKLIAAHPTEESETRFRDDFVLGASARWRASSKAGLHEDDIIDSAPPAADEGYRSLRDINILPGAPAERASLSCFGDVSDGEERRQTEATIAVDARPYAAQGAAAQRNRFLESANEMPRTWTGRRSCEEGAGAGQITQNQKIPPAPQLWAVYVVPLHWEQKGSMLYKYWYPEEGGLLLVPLRRRRADKAVLLRRQYQEAAPAAKNARGAAAAGKSAAGREKGATASAANAAAPKSAAAAFTIANYFEFKRRMVAADLRLEAVLYRQKLLVEEQKQCSRSLAVRRQSIRDMRIRRNTISNRRASRASLIPVIDTQQRPASPAPASSPNAHPVFNSSDSTEVVVLRAAEGVVLEGPGSASASVVQEQDKENQEDEEQRAAAAAAAAAAELEEAKELALLSKQIEEERVKLQEAEEQKERLAQELLDAKFSVSLSKHAAQDEKKDCVKKEIGKLQKQHEREIREKEDEMMRLLVGMGVGVTFLLGLAFCGASFALRSRGPDSGGKIRKHGRSGSSSSSSSSSDSSDNGSGG